MTVGIAQNRINEMNSIARKLADCIEKINSEENEDKIIDYWTNIFIDLDID